MTVKLSFSCPGPEGGNGCPEGHPEIIAWTDGSHSGLKAGWEKVVSKAESMGWQKRPKDQRLHCPQCSERFVYPPEIAGIPLDRWIEAARLCEEGVSPSRWPTDAGLPTPRQWNNAINRFSWMKEAHQRLPDWKPRGDRAAPVPDAMWEKVLERFLSGESKAEICTGEDGWPTHSQWELKMEKDDLFGNKVRVYRMRKRLQEEAKVDLALQIYEEGDRPLYEIMSKAIMNRWAKRLNTDGSFRIRVQAAHEKRGKFLLNEREPLYEAALRFIELGGEVSKLPGQPETVSQTAIHNRVGKDPEFAARYRACIQEGFTRRRVSRKIREAARLDSVFDSLVATLDWDGVVEDINKGVNAYDALQKEGRPSRGQWIYRRRMDPNFADAVDHAYNNQREIKKARTEREREKARRERKLKGPEDPIGTKLNLQLRQNDLYATVNRAVSLGLPKHIRDDVISSMVLAVLEGEYTIEEIGRRSREFTSRYHKTMDTYKLKSYDSTIGDTDLKMIDTFSNEDAMFHEWDDDTEEDEDDDF